MIISGGSGAAPTEPMNAWISGFPKNCSKCPTDSHSSLTTTCPSPTPNRWWSPPAALAAAPHFSYSAARSVSEARNLAVSPLNFTITSTLMISSPPV